MSRLRGPAIILGLLVVAVVIDRSGLLDAYVVLVLILMGVNMMFAVSLNLVNGHMGEFSCGHAAFLGVGAYAASLLTVEILPAALAPWLFPVALLGAGLAAGLVGLAVAVPSFHTRGDYLAIVTLAINFIVKSALENIEAVGGPRGYLGMQPLTTLAWVAAGVIACVLVVRNFMASTLGKGVLAIREDEVAAELMSVHTRRAKMQAFVLSAVFAGVAGGLYAHVVLFIHPSSFSLLKSTEGLVMVYLGGAGSTTGALLGAAVFTVLLEALRFLGVWKWVVIPLVLVVTMLLRPSGLLGRREWSVLTPRPAGVRDG